MGRAEPLGASSPQTRRLLAFYTSFPPRFPGLLEKDSWLSHESGYPPPVSDADTARNVRYRGTKRLSGCVGQRLWKDPPGLTVSACFFPGFLACWAGFTTYPSALRGFLRARFSHENLASDFARFSISKPCFPGISWHMCSLLPGARLLSAAFLAGLRLSRRWWAAEAPLFI